MRAASDEPERPATRIAVISAPNSRVTDLATATTTCDCAPNSRQCGDELDAEHDADRHRQQGDDRQRIDADLAHLLEDRAQTHRLAVAPADGGKVQTFQKQHRRMADAGQRLHASRGRDFPADA